MSFNWWEYTLVIKSENFVFWNRRLKKSHFVPNNHELVILVVIFKRAFYVPILHLILQHQCSFSLVFSVLKSWMPIDERKQGSQKTRRPHFVMATEYTITVPKRTQYNTKVHPLNRKFLCLHRIVTTIKQNGSGQYVLIKKMMKLHPYVCHVESSCCRGCTIMLNIGDIMAPVLYLCHSTL